MKTYIAGIATGLAIALVWWLSLTTQNTFTKQLGAFLIGLCAIWIVVSTVWFIIELVKEWVNG